MKHPRTVAATLGTAAAVATIAVWALSARTEADIAAHRNGLEKQGAAAASRPPSADQVSALPAPVQRFVRFTFPGPVPSFTHVELDMEGRFRRPKTTDFMPTTASQSVAVATPALVFAATTPILPGVWARAYDAYVDGRMEMKAKIMSAVAVVDEVSTPELDRISLRRWLLESPLYPMALLPGGPVRWEPVDEHRARAVVEYRGMTASLIATFGADGRLTRFDAEADGDLDTPYHGSGEHVARDDYQPVEGMMIPMKFVIARAAGGQVYPFWEGRVTRIRFAKAGA
ncbi:hypothetical protein OOT46_21720 [Aquabacterium sp. A7-Y]|uniref:DUF6920 family protein n=1 Tax=Aquabacterium sp. A7-Y TaxID=1349605 RepID=UPI00223D9090|nr:DUF6544 family protein [Aquabacterium sp. A7-Y]MCW7540449.1 hypothetical protein [Aquabacterium sp. A7-Y]